jgi:integrase
MQRALPMRRIPCSSPTPPTIDSWERQKLTAEGSVYQRQSDGRWVAQYKDAKGKIRYLYRKTKGEARKALRQALKDRDEGIIPPSKMTVGLYLDEWLEDIRGTISDRTWITQESIIRCRVKPHIGAKRLAKLTADDVRKMYKREQSASVRHVHSILNHAMRDAIRCKYISTNPLEDVRPPRVHHNGEKDVLSPDDVRKLLSAARGSRYEGIIVLGATCGLRIGETLALRHDDVSFVDGTVTVSNTLWRGKLCPPKTRSSRRTLKLPQIALDVLTRLCKSNGNHRLGFLFYTSNGTAIDASNFYRWGWRPTLRKAGLPETLPYHRLRHGAGSLMLNQNVPVPVVSRYLGHANPGITMKIYAHQIDGTSSMAAQGMDEALV